MKAGKAFLAGVVGGAVMSVLLAIAREGLGMPANIEMILGTMIGLAPSATTWALGLAMHLVISGLIAMLYGLGFEYVSHRAGALPGVLFSLVHIVIGGLFLGALPGLHPLIPEQISPPGAFMSNLGDLGVLLFVVSHAIYGAVVGAMYGPVLHPTRDTAVLGPRARHLGM